MLLFVMSAYKSNFRCIFIALQYCFDEISNVPFDYLIFEFFGIGFFVFPLLWFVTFRMIVFWGDEFLGETEG